MTNEQKIAKHIIDNKLKGTIKLMPICKSLRINSGSEQAIVDALLEKGVIAKADFKHTAIVIKQTPKELFTVTEEEAAVPVQAGNLKELIKASKLSSAEMAKRLGVSKSTIYRAGKNPEKYADVTKKLYELLGVSPVAVAVAESVTHEDEPEINALIAKEKAREDIMIRAMKKMKELDEIFKELI